MSDKYLNLKDHIEEIREYYKKGLEKIKKYYTTNKEETGLKDPPHDILMAIASQFISEAIDVYEKYDLEDFSEKPHEEIKKIIDSRWTSSLYEVCIGCGTEILLKAIILLKIPEKFIEENDMGFDRAKIIVMNNLLTNLNKKQRKRISEVLELIQLKRNKWAHLSFHKLSAYHENYQIFHILEFLYSSFFPEADILKRIKEFKEKGKAYNGGLDFEPIELR